MNCLKEELNSVARRLDQREAGDAHTNSGGACNDGDKCKNAEEDDKASEDTISEPNVAGSSTGAGIQLSREDVEILRHSGDLCEHCGGTGLRKRPSILYPTSKKRPRPRPQPKGSVMNDYSRVINIDEQ